MPEIFAAIGSSLSTLGKLKELADKLKDVEIKSLVADLQIELAEVKVRLAEVMNENTALKAQIQSLGTPQFPRCPSCGKSTWRAERTEAHPVMHDLGVRIRHMKCSDCGFADELTMTANAST